MMISVKRFAVAALICAALQASAFNVTLTPSARKAEISQSIVNLNLVHSCSNGEGYEGAADITSNGKTIHRELGGGTSLKTETIVGNVASNFNLGPGEHSFAGVVTLTDLKNHDTTAGCATSVKFCYWDAVKVEPYGPCHENWDLELVYEGVYDGTPVFSAGGKVLEGAPSITPSAFPPKTPISVHVEDGEWGASKSASIPNDFSGEEEVNCGEMRPKLSSLDMSLPVWIGPGRLGRMVLFLKARSSVWSENLLTSRCLRASSREVPGD